MMKDSASAFWPRRRRSDTMMDDVCGTFSDLADPGTCAASSQEAVLHFLCCNSLKDASNIPTKPGANILLDASWSAHNPSLSAASQLQSGRYWIHRSCFETQPAALGQAGGGRGLAITTRHSCGFTQDTCGHTGSLHSQLMIVQTLLSSKSRNSQLDRCFKL